MRGPGACPGWGATCGPGSCREKGRGGVDEGAWCLSWLGCDLCAPRSPQRDRVATRTSTRPPPCPTSAPCPYRTPCGRQHSSGVQINLSKCIIGPYRCAVSVKDEDAIVPLRC